MVRGVDTLTGRVARPGQRLVALAVTLASAIATLGALAAFAIAG